MWLEGICRITSPFPERLLAEDSPQQIPHTTHRIPTVWWVQILTVFGEWWKGDPVL